MTTPAIPLTTLLGDTTTLFGWMGRFWTQIYTEPDFVRLMIEGRGLSVAQLGINAEETRSLVNRRNIPVLHRERWFPIQIRQSQVGTGGAALLRLGSEPATVLGPQDPDVFKTGRIFQLGGYVAFRDLTVYPVTGGIKGVATLLTDSLDKPTLMLTPADFAIQDSTVVFRKEHDPFSNPDIRVDVEVSITGEVQDRVITLWGMDTMFDWNYISRYLGYCLGWNDVPSTPYHARLLNAMWDSLTSAATYANTLALAAAVYDIPTAVEAETVTSVLTDVDGRTLIVTPHNAYRTDENPSSVTVGTALYAGQPLTAALHLYSNIFEPRQFGEDFRVQVPAVTLPRSFFAAELKNGLTFDWNYTPVVVDGFDRNGNPRLRFDLGGDPEDEQTFWEYFWAQCESSGTSSRACFPDLNDGILVVVDGMTLGYIEPLDFMLRNFIGANCAFLVVDGTKLSLGGSAAAIRGYVGLLQDTIPAHTSLFVIEHRTPPVEEYTLVEIADPVPDDTEPGYQESISQYLGKTARSTATAGSPAGGSATYRDGGVRFNWVAVCK